MIGTGAAFIGSVGGQLLTSEGNLSDRWSSINWIDVSVATGVGFVAGFVAPWTALTPLGSILTNAAASGIQYLLSQGLNGRDIDYVDKLSNRYLERLDDFGDSWWGFFFNSN